MNYGKTKYSASLCAWREAEYEAAREVARRKRRDAIEAIVGVPVLIITAIVLALA